MDEKQADVEAALAEYEPFIVNADGMDKYLGRPRAVPRLERGRSSSRAADAGDLATYAQIYREVSSPLLTDHRRRARGGGHRPVRRGRRAQRRGRRRGRLRHHHAAGHRAGVGRGRRRR